MSSSDYTAMQKLRTLYTVNYNTVPACSNQQLVPIYTDPHTLTNYYSAVQPCHPCAGVVPSHTHGALTHSHNGYGAHVHETSHTHDAVDLSFGQYLSKTVRKYHLSPVENGAVTFTVGKNELFKKDNAVFINNVDLSNNYFKGTVTDYDKKTGEISIGKISNIVGTFSTSSNFQVSIIFENPDLFKLEERMNNLYDYVLNVNLASNPSYKITANSLDDLEQFLYNVYYYLYEINIREFSKYTLTDTYLSVVVNDLYKKLFDIDLNVSLLNISGRNVPLNTLQNKIYELYYYLFEIDLATNASFNPNLN